MRWVLAVTAASAVAACRAAPELAELAPPVGSAQSADPAPTVDPTTGDLLLSWVGGDSSGWHVYVARSTDRGASWSVPVRVTDREHDVHPHGESSPRLVAGPGGALGVAWTNSIPAPGRRWPGSNIRFARSADGGRTWSAAITLNDDTTRGPAGHIFHGAAWAADSTLLVAWMDERGGAAPVDAQAAKHTRHHPEETDEPDATIYLAQSTDFGRSWSPNRPLWGAACPCCRIALARGPDGAVVAGWRQHFAGNVRDVVVAPVGSGPAPTGSRVHVDDWVYRGCPHTGPGLAVDARGFAHVTWYTGKPTAAGVFYVKRSGTGESGAPTPLVRSPTMPTAHPRLAALPDGGALAAWDVTGDGRPVLMIARLSAQGDIAWKREVPSSGKADHPEVAAYSDGTAVVAWTEGGVAGSRLRAVRVGAH
ncbi:MAG: exo-alpha-sialidase [Gemmatimonadales bacterium]